ncbi:transposase [Halomonas sp. QX-2]|uniref:Transposase n=1 Tax=Vreelandella sedimenti TaxID=2729618 RepID=A0A7Z0SS16_9GAMM|nr:Mu transposase C-terminal domain-containing protein [Halomonas sedimenti]NYT75129.1 transposase [Halomonas sedimenti]
MTLNGSNFSDEFDGIESAVLNDGDFKAGMLNDDKFSDEHPDAYSNLGSFDELDITALKEASAKLKVINMVDNRLIGGWTERNIDPILDDLMVNGLLQIRPSWRSVARWKSQYDSNKGLVSLVSRNKFKKGQRKRNKYDKTDSRILQAIDEKFLTKERPSISSAYQYYLDLVEVNNKDVVQGKIQPVCYNTFRRLINEISPYKVAERRFGKRYADITFRKIGKFKKARYLMQRVEIDHTPLDLILLDDNLEIPLGRPYLTVLLDCYSRCIVGFHLGYREPSYDAVRKAILNTCLSKENVKNKFPSIKKDWPCEGKIETLVVDNGAEFWSSSLEVFCQAMGTNIEFNPVAKPWKKPLVERIFKTYKSKLIDQIPGKTFSNVQQLKDYNPQKDAVLPFSEFVHFLYKWVVDIYNYDSYGWESRIPMLAWESGWKNFPPIRYIGLEKEQFILESLPHVKRSLTREGVKLNHIVYVSDELVEYRKNTPPLCGESSVELMVKRDPADVSQVYVFLPNLKKYICVPAVDPDGEYKDVSLFEHQTHIKFNRLYNRSKIDRLALAEARQYIEKRTQNFINGVANSKSKNATKKFGGLNKLAKVKDISSSGASSIVTAASGDNVSTSESPHQKYSTDKNNVLDDNILDSWDDWINELEPY